MQGAYNESSDPLSIQATFPGATVPIYYYICLNTASDNQLATQTSHVNTEFAGSKLIDTKISFITAEIIRCSGQDQVIYDNACGTGKNFDSDCFPYLGTLAATLNRPGILTFVSPQCIDAPLGRAGRIGLNNDPAYVWMDAAALTGGSSVLYNQGTVLVHEYGHIFSLLHPFTPFNDLVNPPTSGTRLLWTTMLL